ncbi:hypothetical protein [Scandinavium goeteborgense]|uniref:hypothetical protein n=1 Tax=Scandinavium goeteborgense TaxID=1851514 RepID=UPI00105FB876|nr:hypothetical protein [Scandinavium goeteborgense]
MHKILTSKWQRARELVLFGSATLASAAANAATNNDVSLPQPDTPFLAKITAFMQNILDVAGGAGALFIAFVSAVAAIGLWIAAPKQGSTALAWVFRVCVGAIAIFNIALLFTWLQK